MNMVLAERNPELMRNGRRSRGPSPNANGHGGTPESSSDDDNSVKKNGSKSKSKQSEYEEKIRVGRDYQATCPDLIPVNERKPELLGDRALLVWSPTKDIPDNRLEDYISVAKEKYGYNGEQALGMLFWHKHDLERAVLDLANFTPFPDEWTVEDKVLFEQAFQFHGKSFHRIRQMLPDKTIASLVKYYYSWKKTRNRQSVMDRNEKTKLKDGGSDNGSENGSNDESDEEKVQQNKQQMSTLKRKYSGSSEDIRIPESNNRINSRWTNDEISLAIQGIRKFGKDYQTIAEHIGTKNESHIRTFFVNYRRRYNLDAVLKEYEAEKEAINNQKVVEASINLEQHQKSQIINNNNKQLNNTNDVEVIDISTSSELSTNSQQNLDQSSSSLQQQQSSSSTSNQQENIIMQIDLENDSSLDNSPLKSSSINISNEPLKTSI